MENENFKLPEHCGIDGCNRPCDIYVYTKNVSRCTEHYASDYAVHKFGGSLRVAGRFHAGKDIMDNLKKHDMQQQPNESMQEYATRCKKHLQTMDSGFSTLVNPN